MKRINTCKIVGTYHELVETGKIMMQEGKGLRVVVDLTKQDKSEAIAILEEVVLAQLKN